MLTVSITAVIEQLWIQDHADSWLAERNPGRLSYQWAHLAPTLAGLALATVASSLLASIGWLRVRRLYL